MQASGPELVGGTSGESEERIRQIFESAAAAAPSVLFLDAIDVIAGKKEVSCLRSVTVCPVDRFVRMETLGRGFLVSCGGL